MFQQHHKLHKRGFIFCCSAGNKKLPEHPTVQQPGHLEYPLSLFKDCPFCIVVGGHGINDSKQACIPSTFKSAGCCVRDEEGASEEDFKQGVTTWSIGENIIIPKIKNQKSDRVVSGTCPATAIVAGAATFILPKLLSMRDHLTILKEKWRIHLNYSFVPVMKPVED